MTPEPDTCRIQVILVEDHPEYREVISLALEDEPDIELSHQFGSAERALRALQDRTVEKKPDVVLLDLNLPGISGLEAIPWFKKYVPKTRIIILSQSNMEADVVQAIRLGAAGYLLKSSTIEQIVAAIRSVAEGGASLDPDIANFILKSLQDRPPAQEPKRALSEREQEILQLLGEGLLKKQIADKLGISINTVAKHIVHIYEKLEVQNAPSAISQAYKSGLLPADE